MTDTYFTMMFTIAHGTLNRIGNEIKCCVNRETVRFKYPEIVWDQYTYHHAVDNQNNHQKSPIRIKKTWATSYWPNRIFAFLLGVTEVNTLLALTNIYGHELIETLEFWKKIEK